MLKFKMAEEDEIEIRGIKRPLVENYSDDEEEEEARRKEGSNGQNHRNYTANLNSITSKNFPLCSSIVACSMVHAYYNLYIASNSYRHPL